ncbi:MAG: hypothetical protein IH589_10590 [Anaerolineales bacterium]|nr:hypothetical protein [Anaerolineales bacterium]
MMDIFSTFFNPFIWGTAITIASILVLFEKRQFVLQQARLLFDLNWIKPAITSSTHTLTHKGGISKYYFNLDYLTTVPEEVASITNWYVEVVNDFKSSDDIDGLIFIEKDSGPIGAISLMGGIISQTGLPAVIARLRKRASHAKISGSPEVLEKLSKGSKVLIITDAITTTRTVKDTMETVNNFGARVVGICTLLDRQPVHKDFVDNVRIVQGVTEKELVSAEVVKADGVY